MGNGSESHYSNKVVDKDKKILVNGWEFNCLLKK